MTHADMTPPEKRHAGFTDAMIRLSVGLEDPADLCDDLGQALERI
jgi:cystathionine beta-lyase/cystathionine gamma-synthase